MIIHSSRDAIVQKITQRRFHYAVSMVHTHPAHRTPARRNSAMKPSDHLMAHRQAEKPKLRNLLFPYECFLSV
jgi:hypothetical protein